MDKLLLVRQCYEKLPQSIKSKPWTVTNHGCKVLQSEDELNAYIAAYGEMHIVKCRAAFQNFPYDDLHHRFEIFDWGCGQGLATLTFIDALQERGLLSQVNRIYLIEPSKSALDRACCWVKQFCSPGIQVIPINKPIPSDDNATMNEVHCSTRISVNIFSNILDVKSFSLSWLANKTASLADSNYMLCVGPKFSPEINTRMGDFCGYFSPEKYFSKIDQYPYQYTTNTNHPYGCSTRCFVHKKNVGLNQAYEELADYSVAPDPYDYVTQTLRGVVDDDTINFYDELRQNCGSLYDVFFRPAINSDTADFVLVSRTNGVLLINVCSNLSCLEEDVRRVECVKANFFSEHLRTLKIDSIFNRSAYGYIKTALYFPNSTLIEVKEKIDELRNANENYCAYLYRFTKETQLKDEMSRICVKGFKKEYYDEIINILSGKWHSYKDGDLTFRLNSRQKEIVVSESKRLRVKGVAGCGKTQVVANRAVWQHLKTGSKVLIVTFNVSLIQYIKMRINQVPADFSPNMFEVINYHQFFKSKANLYSKKKIGFGDYDNSHFFDKYRSKISKYDSIILDEVQDFKESWIQSIIHNFLADNGSVSLFGDGAQNIYERKFEEESKMPPVRDCGFTGRWNEMNEKISLRVINPKIATISSAFGLRFIPTYNSFLEAQGGFMFDDFHIKYWNREGCLSAEKIARNVMWIVDKYNLMTKDVAVLGQSINLLREVASAYENVSGKQAMINFETEDQYNKIKCQNRPTYFKKDLDEIRHAAKTHFTTACEQIKFSTIHSFKGWEAKSIILVLQPTTSNDTNYSQYGIQERENTPALIYTGITRARCNLFIINLNNLEYHNFFSSIVK